MYKHISQTKPSDRKCNLEWVWEMPTEERAHSELSDNASDEDADFEVVEISDTE